MKQISDNRYNKLLKAEATLEALEEQGVDNWELYEDALENIQPIPDDWTSARYKVTHFVAGVILLHEIFTEETIGWLTNIKNHNTVQIAWLELQGITLATHFEKEATADEIIETNKLAKDNNMFRPYKEGETFTSIVTVTDGDNADKWQWDKELRAWRLYD